MKQLSIVVDEQDYQNIMCAIKNEMDQNNGSVILITNKEISEIGQGCSLGRICKQWVEQNVDEKD